MQANLFKTDTEGVVESDRIKWVAFIENVWAFVPPSPPGGAAFFPQGQLKQSVRVRIKRVSVKWV